jgi:hypothetical protein
MRMKEREDGTPRHATSWRMMNVVMVLVLLAAVSAEQILTRNGDRMARAEVFDCLTESHYFDGKGDKTTANRLGAAATISERFGAVCDNDQSSFNFVTTWAMISPSNGLGWAQSGYLRWYNHCNIVFAQDSPDGSAVHTFTGTTCQQDGGQTNIFTESYDGGCSCIDQYEGGRILQHTMYDPTKRWSTPWQPQFFGEAASLSSDMPGNSGSPEQFTNLKYQDSSGFHNYPCMVLTPRNDGAHKRTDGEEWFNETPTCPNFNIYTDTAG